MLQKRTAKIVTIGSLAGVIGVPFQGYYAASEAFLIPLHIFTKLK